MFYGIKNTHSNSGIKYSSLTTEEKFHFHKKVLQDGLKFSTNFSSASFMNYNNLSIANTLCQREFIKAKKIFNETKFDETKKRELLELARHPNQPYALPLSMYNKNEVKYFKAVIIPYVRKENEVKQMQKNLFSCYQNYVIYKDISELWTIELDAINRSMNFEKYRRKINSLEEMADVFEERKEAAKKKKIEKIQRRIKLHIAQNKSGKKQGDTQVSVIYALSTKMSQRENTFFHNKKIYLVNQEKEAKEEISNEFEEVKKSKINFDDWL